MEREYQDLVETGAETEAQSQIYDRNWKKAEARAAGFEEINQELEEEIR